MNFLEAKRKPLVYLTIDIKWLTVKSLQCTVALLGIRTDCTEIFIGENVLTSDILHL